MRWFRNPSLLAAFIVLTACGVAHPRLIDGGAGVQDAGPLDAGIIYTTSPCPAALPTPGAPCTSPPGVGLLVCEYGGDEWGNCTTLAICTAGLQGLSLPQADGGWYIGTIPPDAGCDVQTTGCPATFDADAGADAGVSCVGSQPTICEYGSQGECGCDSYGDWWCRGWTDGVGSGCPVPRPKLGSTCTAEGQVCEYGTCCGIDVSLGPWMVCTGGLWHVDEAICGCPSGP